MDGIDPLERLAIVAEKKEAREQKLVQKAEQEAKLKAYFQIGALVVLGIVSVVGFIKIKKMQQDVKKSASQFLEYKR